MSQFPAPAYGDTESVRQQTIDRMTEAFAQGRLSLEEYEKRVSSVTALESPDAILELASDLPAVPILPPGPGKARRSAPQSALSMRSLNRSIVGVQAVSSMCIMGDRSMAGNWLTSDAVNAFTVMGSTRMDFRNTELPPGRVKIDLFTMMSDTRIIVPQDVPVRMNAGVFMGDARVNRDVNQQTAGAETWIEVNGFILMGDLRVSTS
ncbi:MAG TPA: LiaF-related protein [Spirochaetales bacterium]|nr:LiaF-related protein [Spirochaetales bacterium]